MKTFFYSVFLFMLSQSLFAQTGDEEYDKLQAATFRYIEFVNHLGGNTGFDPTEPLICAPNCKKIFNGELQTESREELVSQLLSIKKNHGHWVIKPVDIVISPNDYAAALRVVVAIENAGLFTAIVILRFSPDLQVIEINEVFNQFKGIENKIPKIR